MLLLSFAAGFAGLAGSAFLSSEPNNEARTAIMRLPKPAGLAVAFAAGLVGAWLLGAIVAAAGVLATSVGAGDAGVTLRTAADSRLTGGVRAISSDSVSGSGCRV